VKWRADGNTAIVEYKNEKVAGTPNAQISVRSTWQFEISRDLQLQRSVCLPFRADVSAFGRQSEFLLILEPFISGWRVNSPPSVGGRWYDFGRKRLDDPGGDSAQRTELNIV
jgi:hypothetical protein